MRIEKIYTIFLLPSGNVSSKNALLLEEDLILSGYNYLEIYLLVIFSSEAASMSVKLISRRRKQT